MVVFFRTYLLARLVTATFQFNRFQTFVRNIKYVTAVHVMNMTRSFMFDKHKTAMILLHEMRPNINGGVTTFQNAARCSDCIFCVTLCKE